MEFDFQKALEEASEVNNVLAIELFEKEYERYKDMEIEQQRMHASILSTSAGMAAVISVTLLKNYHEELMKYLQK